MALPRVAITGIGGYGRLHLENARRLQEAGRLEIASLIDPAVAAERSDVDGVPLYANLTAALERHAADVVIVATPLDTHAALAEEAMRAGADVLLEKPPVPTVADFEHLLAVQRETGRAVQVGFQSLGSDAVEALKTDALRLGEVRAVSASGLWSRPLAYWTRARWAGRRTLDGHPVVDGVATNALAHAVATALRIAGYDTLDSVDSVEVELFRTNKIEADDTTAIRVRGAGRPTVTCALTLSAPAELHDRPDKGATVTVQGAARSADFSYTTDDVVVGDESRRFGRTDLLENLLDHGARGAALIVPLESTGAFLRVVEAIRLAPDPAMIDAAYLTWQGEGSAAFPVITGIEATVRESSSRGLLFSELNLPWAVDRTDRILATAEVDGVVVATERDGHATTAFSSPHPFLHPVRTIGGVVVSAAHPADHDWHTGVSFTVQDADGTNFWGGRTYVRDQDYQSLDDHGRIEVLATDSLADGVDQRLAWRGVDGALVLEETRRMRWHPFSTRQSSGWALDFGVELVPAGGRGEVALQSPGSKGRESAGYGGFFWRLPACADIDIFTADARGEDDVNGSRSPWFAWTAEFLPFDGFVTTTGGEASIVLALAPQGGAAPGDAWFVRARDYPGIGSAVAWDTALPVSSAGLSRRYLAAVLDGRITRDEASAVADALTAGLATWGHPRPAATDVLQPR